MIKAKGKCATIEAKAMGINTIFICAAKTTQCFISETRLWFLS